MLLVHELVDIRVNCKNIGEIGSSLEFYETNNIFIIKC